MMQAENKLSPRLEEFKESLNRNASNTFMGLTFAEKLIIDECKKQKIGKQYVYTHVTDDEPCIEYPNEINKELPNYYTAKIIFPYKDTLLRMSNNYVLAVIVDGKLEGISFNTSGLKVQKYLFAELQEKYGKPTYLKPLVMVNALGGKFETISAIWMFKNLIVNYESAVGRIDSGKVDIYTSIGIEKQNTEIKKLINNPKPL